MQCAGIISCGARCSRFSTDLYCWQHQNQNTSAIAKDLELLIYSYLTLEEVVILFHNDPEFRDEIILRADYIYPTWNEIFINNHYYFAEFLLEHEDYPTDINYAIQYGDLRMLKLLYKYDIQFTKKDLDFTAFEAMDDIFFYLISIGVEPDQETYDLAEDSLRDYEMVTTDLSYTDRKYIQKRHDARDRILNYLDTLNL